MPTDSDSPLTQSPAPLARATDRDAGDSAAYAALRLRVAQALRSRSPDLASRWALQVRGVTLRDSDDTPAIAPGELAAELVEAFAETLASDGATADDMIGPGMAFGVAALARGASLHHTLKGLELLTAMVLFSVETALSADGDVAFGAADGVRLARRLHHTSSLVALSATKGYTQAVGEALRDRFRHLRHDLRNPLGTIKSALALMDDESLPADARQSPRFRAMATRNARALDAMIVSQLSDAAALLPSFAHQHVSLRLVACAVRRDLRAEAEARGVTVMVSNARTEVRVDAVGLELLLHELLLATLHEAVAGEELSIEFDEPAEGRVSVRLSASSSRPPVHDEGGLRRIRALAARMGAALEPGSTLVLSMPVQALTTPAMAQPAVEAAVEAAAEPAVEPAAVLAEAEAEPEPARSAGGDSSHDLRSAREREHGQTGAL